VAGTVWKENISIADKYYQPGKFTTFVAYEWTSAPNSRNMHRNVFFKESKKVPALPFSAIVSSAVKAQGQVSARTTIEGTAKRTAKEVAEELRGAFRRQGWI
jgi:hypothetical protein